MSLFDKKVLFGLVGGFVLGKTSDFIFGSDTAKKAYLKAATAGFIAKDCAMEKFEAIQAQAMDIADVAREEADQYQAKKDAEKNTPCCAEFRGEEPEGRDDSENGSKEDGE